MKRLSTFFCLGILILFWLGAGFPADGFPADGSPAEGFPTATFPILTSPTLAFPTSAWSSPTITFPTVTRVWAAETIPDTPLNLTLSPINILVHTVPGASTTATLKIRNNGPVAENLRLDLATFQASDNGQSPVIREFTPADDFQSWLRLADSQVTVEPGEWLTTEVQFAPPLEASLSYYYAVIIRRAATVNAEPGATVIAGAPAILVLATVDTPQAVRELQLSALTLPRRVYEFLPIDLAIKIKNTGNVHLAPLGDVFLDGPGGQDVGYLTINPQNGLVLPGSEREFAVRWDDGFPRYEEIITDGKVQTDAAGQPQRRLRWDWRQADKFRFGRYTAHVFVVYDNGERDIPLEAKLSFWVIPWRLLAVGGILGLLILAGLSWPVWLTVSWWRRRRAARLSSARSAAGSATDRNVPNVPRSRPKPPPQN